MNVLLVDNGKADVQAFLDALAGMTELVIRATVVESSAAAIEKLREHSIDLTITEHAPPEIDALALLARYRQQPGHVPPVVVLSRFLDRRMVTEAFRNGARDVLLKDPGGAYLEVLPRRLPELVGFNACPPLCPEKRLPRDPTEILCDARARLHLLVREAPFAIQIYDRDGNLVQVNKAHEKIWGIPEERSIWHYNLFKDRQLKEKNVLGLLRWAFEGETVTVPDFEYTPTLPDAPIGASRWISSCAYPIRDADNSVKYVAIIQEDITARKQVEDELRTSRGFLRNIINNCPDPIFVKDEKHRWLMVNDAFCALFGKERESLIGRNDFEVFSSEETWAFWAQDNEALLTGKADEREFHFRAANGQSRTLAICRSLFVSEKGRFVIGAIRDITPIRDMVDALRLKDERFQEALQASRNVIYRFNVASGRYDYISPNVTEMLGYPMERFIEGSLDLYDTIHPDDLKPIQDEIDRLLKTGKGPRRVSARFQYRRRAANGQYFWFSDWPTLVYGADGNLETVVGSASDITAQKRVEEELKMHRDHLEELVRARTADLEKVNAKLRDEIVERKKIQERAHQLSMRIAVAEKNERERIAIGLHDDLAQNLAFCKMTAQSLRNDLPASARDALDRQAAILDASIEKIRSMVFELYPPVLSELGLEDAIGWLTHRFQEKHALRCAFHRHGKPAPLTGTLPETLFNATRELLTNVVKHAHAQRVDVTVEWERDAISIRVVDDGQGFDYASIDPLQSETKGFGLFNVRQRVEGVNGKLNVKSALGKGAEATLWAPLEISQ